VFDSGTMTGSTSTKSISVNTTGKNQLRLYVDLSTNGNSSDHADWANARSTCNPEAACSKPPGRIYHGARKGWRFRRALPMLSLALLAARVESFRQESMIASQS
jgi:hypothetical protein